MKIKLKTSYMLLSLLMFIFIELLFGIMLFVNFRKILPDDSLFQVDTIYYLFKILLVIILIILIILTISFIINILFYKKNIIEIHDDYMINRFLIGKQIIYYKDIKDLRITSIYLYIKTQTKDNKQRNFLLNELNIDMKIRDLKQILLEKINKQ